MKKILYNNWIARTFLWGDYDTITLAAWVCTKYKNKEEMPQRIRNHECTHARQWVECMIASGVIIWTLVIFSEYLPGGSAFPSSCFTYFMCWNIS